MQGPPEGGHTGHLIYHHGTRLHFRTSLGAARVAGASGALVAGACGVVADWVVGLGLGVWAGVAGSGGEGVLSSRSDAFSLISERIWFCSFSSLTSSCKARICSSTLSWRVWTFLRDRHDSKTIKEPATVNRKVSAMKLAPYMISTPRASHPPSYQFNCSCFAQGPDFALTLRRRIQQAQPKLQVRPMKSLCKGRAVVAKDFMLLCLCFDLTGDRLGQRPYGQGRKLDRDAHYGSWPVTAYHVPAC